MQAIRSTVYLIQRLTFILQLPANFNGYLRQKLQKVGVPLWEHELIENAAQPFNDSGFDHPIPLYTENRTPNILHVS